MTASIPFDIALPQLDLEASHLYAVIAAHIGTDDTGCANALGVARYVWARRQGDPSYKIIEESKLLRAILTTISPEIIVKEGKDCSPAHANLLMLLRWFAPPGDDQSLENSDPVISNLGFLALIGFVDAHKSLNAILLELEADREFNTDELRVAATTFRKNFEEETRRRKELLQIRLNQRVQFQCSMHQSSEGGSHSVSISG